MKNKIIPVFLLASLISVSMLAQQKGDPKATEFYSPVPKVVMPGAATSDAPSDAIVLFDGKNLDQWSSVKTPGAPAAWNVADGILTVNKSAGNIQTKKSFADYQLHLEWRIPANITGEGQARGNSGVFLASTGPGDDGYEIQILDCFNNSTYVNGQTGSVYKQAIPMANACKKPGEWQTLDIVFQAPKFNDAGKKTANAKFVSIKLNGKEIQKNVEAPKPTGGELSSEEASMGPLLFQGDHGPVAVRNVRVKEINR